MYVRGSSAMQLCSYDSLPIARYILCDSAQCCYDYCITHIGRYSNDSVRILLTFGRVKI